MFFCNWTGGEARPVALGSRGKSMRAQPRAHAAAAGERGHLDVALTLPFDEVLERWPRFAEWLEQCAY